MEYYSFNGINSEYTRLQEVKENFINGDLSKEQFIIQFSNLVEEWDTITQELLESKSELEELQDEVSELHTVEEELDELKTELAELDNFYITCRKHVSEIPEEVYVFLKELFDVKLGRIL
jgi:predicted nuclease with TOPRIM domain